VGVDVYDPFETDPAKSRAVESSLWEMEALRNHASPQVGGIWRRVDSEGVFLWGGGTNVSLGRGAAGGEGLVGDGGLTV
jgi:hypothetical protein